MDTLALPSLAVTIKQFKHLIIETAAGEIITDIIGENMVKVNMGRPVTDASAIPVTQDSGTVVMKNRH